MTPSCTQEVKYHRRIWTGLLNVALGRDHYTCARISLFHKSFIKEKTQIKWKLVSIGHIHRSQEYRLKTVIKLFLISGKYVTWEQGTNMKNFIKNTDGWFLFPILLYRIYLRRNVPFYKWEKNLAQLSTKDKVLQLNNWTDRF